MKPWAHSHNMHTLHVIWHRSDMVQFYTHIDPVSCMGLIVNRFHDPGSLGVYPIRWEKHVLAYISAICAAWMYVVCKWSLILIRSNTQCRFLSVACIWMVYMCTREFKMVCRRCLQRLQQSKRTLRKKCPAHLTRRDLLDKQDLFAYGNEVTKWNKVPIHERGMEAWRLEPQPQTAGGSFLPATSKPTKYRMQLNVEGPQMLFEIVIKRIHLRLVFSVSSCVNSYYLREVSVFILSDDNYI